MLRPRRLLRQPEEASEKAKLDMEKVNEEAIEENPTSSPDQGSSLDEGDLTKGTEESGGDVMMTEVEPSKEPIIEAPAQGAKVTAEGGSQDQATFAEQIKLKVASPQRSSVEAAPVASATSARSTGLPLVESVPPIMRTEYAHLPEEELWCL